MPPEAIAASILHALSKEPEGLRRSEISGLLHRNVCAAEIAQALMVLTEAGKVWMERGLSGRRGGRPVEVWFAVMPVVWTEMVYEKTSAMIDADPVC